MSQLTFRFALLASALTAPASVTVAQSSVVPLPQAHAHNDYRHTRPLLDALENGFCSVEADIFLIDGQILVAHSFVELQKENTLERLYLKPLMDRVKQNGGRVYKEGPEFTLLIDIKGRGADAFRAVNETLSQHPDVFSHFSNGKFHRKAVTAIISGDRAFDVIEKSEPRFAAIDGRLTDLGSKRSSHLMPILSDNWRNHFKWRGQGKMPAKERDKLRDLVQRAHAQKRRIRFWASPDTPEVWTVLHEAGADLINTDDLSGLSSHLKARQN